MVVYNVCVFTGDSEIDKGNSKTLKFESDDSATEFGDNLAIFLDETIRMARKTYEGNGYYHHPK